MTVIALSDRYTTVPAPAKAIALDIQTAANRLALDIGGRIVTPQGLNDAHVQAAIIRDLLDQLGNAL